MTYLNYLFNIIYLCILRGSELLLRGRRSKDHWKPSGVCHLRKWTSCHQRCQLIDHLLHKVSFLLWICDSHRTLFTVWLRFCCFIEHLSQHYHTYSLQSFQHWLCGWRQTSFWFSHGLIFKLLEKLLFPLIKLFLTILVKNFLHWINLFVIIRIFNFHNCYFRWTGLF